MVQLAQNPPANAQGGHGFQSLGWEDSTVPPGQLSPCATTEARVPESPALQEKKPLQGEARAHRTWRAVPAHALESRGQSLTRVLPIQIHFQHLLGIQKKLSELNPPLFKILILGGFSSYHLN